MPGLKQQHTKQFGGFLVAHMHPKSDFRVIPENPLEN